MQFLSRRPSTPPARRTHPVPSRHLSRAKSPVTVIQTPRQRGHIPRAPLLTTGTLKHSAPDHAARQPTPSHPGTGISDPLDRRNQSVGCAISRARPAFASASRQGQPDGQGEERQQSGHRHLGGGHQPVAAHAHRQHVEATVEWGSAASSMARARSRDSARWFPDSTGPSTLAPLNRRPYLRHFRPPACRGRRRAGAPTTGRYPAHR